MRKVFQISFVLVSFLSCTILLTASYLFAKSVPIKMAKIDVIERKPVSIANKKTICGKAQTRTYRIKGKKYSPQKHIEYLKEGVASYYGKSDGFHGKPTATGDRFDADKFTAAHKTLPIPCYVRVTNKENGKSLVLKVNDRGPFHGNRIIDVSEAAAKKLGFHYQGTANVKVETLVDETLKLQNEGIEI